MTIYEKPMSLGLEISHPLPIYESPGGGFSSVDCAHRMTTRFVKLTQLLLKFIDWEPWNFENVFFGTYCEFQIVNCDDLLCMVSVCTSVDFAHRATTNLVNFTQL